MESSPCVPAKRVDGLRKAQRRGRPSECISRFGVFWGGRDSQGFARGIGVTGLCVRLPQKSGFEKGVFQPCCQCGRRLRKKGTRRRVSGRPPAALPCPCSCVRRHERERPQGPAGRRPEVPASGRFASLALSSAGDTLSDCAFRSHQGGDDWLWNREKNRQTAKHGLPWRKAAPSEMAARRSGRRIRSCWSCRARCGSCAAPCS